MRLSLQVLAICCPSPASPLRRLGLHSYTANTDALVVVRAANTDEGQEARPFITPRSTIHHYAATVQIAAFLRSKPPIPSPEVRNARLCRPLRAKARGGTSFSFLVSRLLSLVSRLSSSVKTRHTRTRECVGAMQTTGWKAADANLGDAYLDALHHYHMQHACNHHRFHATCMQPSSFPCNMHATIILSITTACNMTPQDANDPSNEGCITCMPAKTTTSKRKRAAAGGCETTVQSQHLCGARRPRRMLDRSYCGPTSCLTLAFSGR